MVCIYKECKCGIFCVIRTNILLWQYVNEQIIYNTSTWTYIKDNLICQGLQLKSSCHIWGASTFHTWHLFCVWFTLMIYILQLTVFYIWYARSHEHKPAHRRDIEILETSKYWVDIHQGHSYLIGVRCLFIRCLWKNSTGFVWLV